MLPRSLLSFIEGQDDDFLNVNAQQHTSCAVVHKMCAVVRVIALISATLSCMLYIQSTCLLACSLVCKAVHHNVLFATGPPARLPTLKAISVVVTPIEPIRTCQTDVNYSHKHSGSFRTPHRSATQSGLFTCGQQQ